MSGRGGAAGSEFCPTYFQRSWLSHGPPGLGVTVGVGVTNCKPKSRWIFAAFPELTTSFRLPRENLCGKTTLVKGQTEAGVIGKVGLFCSSEKVPRYCSAVRHIPVLLVQSKLRLLNKLISSARVMKP